MKTNCQHCKIEFDESTARFSKRLRNPLTLKLCSDCLRLENAETNAAKREHAKYSKTIPGQLDLFVKQHGKISPAFLQRKLKVSYDEAKTLCDKNTRGLDER